jgi:dienelactone hydrolase
MLRVVCLLLGMALVLGLPRPSSALEEGRGVDRVRAGDTEIVVFTYRPRACAEPSILIVFHGLNRKAERARNAAEDWAEAACLIVFAPLLDRDRFPNWRFQRAGVVRNGRVQPRENWTAPVVESLVQWARRQTNRPGARLYMFGHSAGGQFLSRLFAYAPVADVDRIVIANPSVFVAPLLGEAAPYGFEGVFSGQEAERRLRAYLALPITVYLGMEDTGEKNLVKTDAAFRQGENRLQRGRTIFRLAKNVAAQRGWPFNWRLVEVAGVGHSSRGMLRAPAFGRALGLQGPVKD